MSGLEKTHAPFRVYKSGDGWFLVKRFWPWTTTAGFETAGDAIDHAYRNWPWSL